MTTPARFNPWARRRLLACSFTCALAGMAAATVALAPVRLSTTTLWPSCSPIRAATRRAITSVAPPAA